MKSIKENLDAAITALILVSGGAVVYTFAQALHVI